MKHQQNKETILDETPPAEAIDSRNRHNTKKQLIFALVWFIIPVILMIIIGMLKSD